MECVQAPVHAGRVKPQRNKRKVSTVTVIDELSGPESVLLEVPEVGLIRDASRITLKLDVSN